MYKKIALIAFVAFIANATCFAQSNFKEGYIIDAKGDTVRGHLDDRGHYRNSEQISFKASSGSETQELSPTDISGYKVGSKVYRATSINDHEQAVTVFLELINDGSLKLLYRKDQSDQMRFYVKNGANIYELTNEPREIQQDGKSYVFYSKAYIGLLSSLTNDCGDRLGDNLPFTLKAISNYVSQYNACKGDKAYVSDKPNDKTSIKKSVHVGVNSSQVKTMGDAYFSETGTRAGLSAGFGLHMNFPNINDNIYLDIVAEYNQKGAEADKEQINFDLHYLNLAPGVSYVYPKGKLKPVIGAGFVAGYLLNKESAYIKKSSNGQESRIFYRPPHTDNEVTYEVGYEAKAGLKYELTAETLLIFSAKYSKTLIPFDYISNSYWNETVSLQIGLEF